MWVCSWNARSMVDTERSIVISPYHIISCKQIKHTPSAGNARDGLKSVEVGLSVRS